MQPVPSALLKIRPLDPWLPSLLRRYARLFKHQFTVERRQGALFLLDQTSKVDRSLLLKGQWEPDNLRILQSLIQRYANGPRRVFLDIGAHGALYAILCAKAHPFDRIVIVEADPSNVSKIHANLLLNGLAGQAEVLHAAASGSPGAIEFVITKDSSRSYLGSGAGTSSVIDKHVTVPAIAIDSIVREENAFIVAKIDVEGHELDVLDGMSDMLRANFGILQIESLGANIEPLYSRLAALGYALERATQNDHFFVRANAEP